MIGVGIEVIGGVEEVVEGVVKGLMVGIGLVVGTGVEGFDEVVFVFVVVVRVKK